MDLRDAVKHFEREASVQRGQAQRALEEHASHVADALRKLTEAPNGYVQPGIAGTYVRMDKLDQANAALARLWGSLEAVEIIDNVYPS